MELITNGIILCARGCGHSIPIRDKPPFSDETPVDERGRYICIQPCADFVRGVRAQEAAVQAAMPSAADIGEYLRQHPEIIQAAVSAGVVTGPQPGDPGAPLPEAPGASSGPAVEPPA